MKQIVISLILVILLAGCVVQPIDQEVNAREYFDVPASGKTVRETEEITLPPYIIDTSVDPLTKSSARAYVEGLENLKALPTDLSASYPNTSYPWMLENSGPQEDAGYALFSWGEVALLHHTVQYPHPAPYIPAFLLPIGKD